jgi:hypothetical protein
MEKSAAKEALIRREKAVLRAGALKKSKLSLSYMAHRTFSSGMHRQARLRESLRRTACPIQGKSASSRVWCECTLAEGLPQREHPAWKAVVLTTIVITFPSVSIWSKCKLVGSGRRAWSVIGGSLHQFCFAFRPTSIQLILLDAYENAMKSKQPTSIFIESAGVPASYESMSLCSANM